jgi:hypothetical protein
LISALQAVGILKIVTVFVAVYLVASRDRLFSEINVIIWVEIPYLFVHAILQLHFIHL